MAVKTVLFDMDGTLLNMGESAFEKEYLKRMVIFLEQRYPGHGKDLVKAVGYGAEMMKVSDGSRTNLEVFWEGFEKAREHAYRFATAEGFDTHALAVKDRK